MKIQQAELAVVDEWRAWAKANALATPKGQGADALIFYGYLQSARPELLSFRCSGDKWQRVHSWLLSRQLVAD